MKLKHNVRPQSLCPEIVLAIIVADSVYRANDAELVVTSLNDSTHSTTSLHYAGAAVDLRTRNIPGPIREVIREQIDDRLTYDYDVVLESDHIHIEYQPRRP